MDTTTVDETIQQLTDLTTTVEALLLAIDDHMESMTPPQVHAVHDWLSHVKSMMTVTMGDLDQKMIGFVPRDTKELMWTGIDGREYRTEVRWQAVRTDVDRDGLLSAVRKSVRTLNESTGEMETDHARLVDTLIKTYRLEPRWTDIKKLGIDPDEYAKATYKATVKSLVVDTPSPESIDTGDN